MSRNNETRTGRCRERTAFTNQPDARPCKSYLPIELASILLVEADPELRSSRRLIMGSLEHPVLAVAGYHDLPDLPEDNNCCLVAIDLYPSEHEARRVASHVRKIWPDAKILVFGEPSDVFEDWLYDESVRLPWSPETVIQSARLLIGAS